MLLGGCATLNFYSSVDSYVATGQYADADKVIETNKLNYKGESELVYYMDKGALLQMAGNYKESTALLEKGDVLLDALYTKSISKEAVSFLTNDLTLPYSGEDFEQVMINVLKALNFMYEGNYQDAQIEARKVNNKLNLLSDMYEGKNIYKADAFARYISAFCFEATGDNNNAFIDYKKSIEAYTQYQTLYGTALPEQVIKDAMRTAEALQFNDKLKELKDTWGQKKYISQSEMNKYGELLLVVYDGMAPFKTSKYLTTTVYDDKKNPYVIRVAFPQFNKRPAAVQYITVDNGTGVYTSAVAEDITEIAVKNLESKNLLISIKAIARAAAKFFAEQAITQKTNGNAVVNVLASIYNIASEQADTRSWRTLPARFHFVRVPVKAGKSTVKVTFYEANGSTNEQVLDIKVKAGKKMTMPVYRFN